MVVVVVVAAAAVMVVMVTRKSHEKYSLNFGKFFFCHLFVLLTFLKRFSSFFFFFFFFAFAFAASKHFSYLMFFSIIEFSELQYLG